MRWKMKRLIDADALIEYIKECAEAAHDNREWDMEQGYLNAIECVEEQPTIDAEPVKHSKWIESDEFDEFSGRLYRCSNCNTFVIEDMDNYCPFCGARMDGE
jgi:rubrerythrin